MSTRKIKDAVDHGTKELIYFKGHAKATYMSDGSTVEDTINNIESKIDLSDYVTTDELEGYAKIEAIPSLEGYVTETELNNKGFLTEHQDISHLASRNWVESQGYAHQEDLLEISFNDIQDSPISIDDSGMINFVDETGNVGFQINEEGLRVTDVIAGEHKLSEKANASDIPSLDGYAKTEDIPSVDGLVKTEDLPNFDEFAKTEDIPSLDGYAKTSDIPSLDGYAKTEDIPSLDDYASKEWVNNRNYATEYDLKTIDYSSINNVPVSEDETGELNITDESGNIGMKVASEAVYAKDFIAGEHKLSEKVDKDEVLQKQDVISDLETIRQGAAKGATALQSYTEQYKGTVTGVKINGTTKNPSSGVVDLGTVITAHQDISGKADKTSLAAVATSGSYEDLSNKPFDSFVYTGEQVSVASGNSAFNIPTIDSSGYIKSIRGIEYDYEKVNLYTTGIKFITETGEGDWEIHKRGDGTKFLSDDGTYKTISGGGGSSDANVQAVAYNFDDWMNESTKRSCRDAVDLTTGEKIYFAGHADYIQYNGGTLIDYIDDKAAAAKIIKWDVEAGPEVSIPHEVLAWAFTQEGILILNGGVATLVYDENSGDPYIQSAVVKDSVIIANKVFSPALGSLNEEAKIDSYPIGGGSSNANVQAVDTGDVLDDVAVDYATKTYVDGLVGDINSVLESIING